MSSGECHQSIIVLTVPRPSSRRRALREGPRIRSTLQSAIAKSALIAPEQFETVLRAYAADGRAGPSLHGLMSDFEWMIDELHVCGDAVLPRGLGPSIHDAYRLGCRV